MLVTAVDLVVVIGASGFGREALDVLEAMRDGGHELTIVGVADDSPSEANLRRLEDRGVSYLGTLAHVLAIGQPEWRFVIGIGSPSVRRRIASLIEGAGREPFTAVHPGVTFGARSLAGEGCVVCAGTTVSTNVRLGRYVHLNPHATIGHDAVLGDFVSVNPAAVISGEVVVGQGTLVGAAATVLQNLTVGEDTLIGASSLVTRDVPDAVVVKGIPGRWPGVTFLGRGEGMA